MTVRVFRFSLTPKSHTPFISHLSLVINILHDIPYCTLYFKVLYTYGLLWYNYFKHDTFKHDTFIIRSVVIWLLDIRRTLTFILVFCSIFTIKNYTLYWFNIFNSLYI